MRTFITLTPINAKNDENKLELAVDRIVGLMSFPTATLVITDIPNEHAQFSVKETAEQIKSTMNARNWQSPLSY